MDLYVKYSFLILACFSLCKVNALCPYKCDCREESVSCPVGVSLIKDGCNCCKICARQDGESCDTQAICDPHKGLVCDFAAENSLQGRCKVQQGRSCSYNGRTYMNGEMFQPTCKHQCWCVDGTVGCLSLCPHETRVPRSRECPSARLSVSEGECCEKWFCGSDDNIWELPLDHFWDKYVDEKSESEITLATLPGYEVVPPPSAADNSIQPEAREEKEEPYWDVSDLNRHSYYKNMFPGQLMSDNTYNTEGDGGSDGDELIDYQMAQVLMEKGGNGLRDWFGDDIFDEDEELYEYENWGLTNDIVGDYEARRKKTNSNCAVQTTSWSPCSKSCGMGIATRVTNNNPECKLSRESRLCNWRPCDDADYVTPKRGKHCTRHKREHKRNYFSYAGCTSVRAYRPRYCGGCDDGRCCTPQSTRTVKIRFRCENSETFVKSMLMIRSCRCHNNCAVTSADSVFVSRDLHDDMQKLNEA